MLTQSFRRMFCSASQQLSKWNTLQSTLLHQKHQIHQLQQQSSKLQSHSKQANNTIQTLRQTLTKQVSKTDDIWRSSKLRSQHLKSQSLKQFARDIVKLAQQFERAKTAQKEEHPEELRQGFELTERLFMHTLTKFEIVRTEVKVGQKVGEIKKGEKEGVKVVEEIEVEDKERKGTIAQVIEQGWMAEKTVIVPARVVAYV